MRRLLTGAALLVIAVLALAPPAGAEGELGVEMPGGGPLFELDDIAPGMTGSQSVVITNNTEDPGDLVVEVADLVDLENGCNDPELEHPDTTCDPDGGELSRDLLVTITDADGGEYYEGTVRDLAGGAVIDTSLAGGESLELFFAWEFVYSSPNDTQTDRVGFDIEISLTNDVASPQVLGESLRRTGPVTVSGADLARTGLDVMGVAQTGVAAIVLGVAARVLASRRYRVTSAARLRRR